MSLVGKQFPNITVDAMNEMGDTLQINVLEEAKKNNKKVILFWYPKDFTYVCPTEIHKFQEALKQFEDACPLPWHRLAIVGRLRTGLQPMSILDQRSHVPPRPFCDAWVDRVPVMPYLSVYRRENTSWCVTNARPETLPARFACSPFCIHNERFHSAQSFSLKMSASWTTAAWP